MLLGYRYRCLSLLYVVKTFILSSTSIKYKLSHVTKKIHIPKQVVTVTSDVEMMMMNVSLWSMLVVMLFYDRTCD